MSHPIRIIAGDVLLDAELNDSATAQAILAELPFDYPGTRWGDEIYFSIPVDATPESAARAEMAVGELAFWPPGNAFCIFFGATPASHEGEPRAASPCNPVGRILGDAVILRDVPNRVTIRIEEAPEND